MNSLFVGTYPGLSERMLEKIVKTIIEYADTKEDRVSDYIAKRLKELGCVLW